MDLYEIIINDPLLLVIFAVCGIFIIFTMLKKLFKYAFALVCFVALYIGYLSITNQPIPDDFDELKDDIRKNTEIVKEKILDQTDDVLKEVNNEIKKIIKDKK